MTFFYTRSIWLDLDISKKIRVQKIKETFGGKQEITERDKAIECLSSVVERTSTTLISQIHNRRIYDLLLDIVCIFNEVMNYYEEEKKNRAKMVEMGFHDKGFLDSVMSNRNIERDIIDACNIWIENCVLYQTNLEENEKKESILDKDLLVDLYMFGFASHGLSLLRLSQDLEENTFYGLSIDPDNEMPLNVLKRHPVIYYNPAVGGNQSILEDKQQFDETMTVAKGFAKEYGVSLISFLGRLIYIERTLLKNNPRALCIMTKNDFIRMMDELDPPINCSLFYECISINKEKLKSQLKDGENTIWRMGTNKYRLEIRPIIELDDGNVLINYAACSQTINLWFSYCKNGGSCYSNARRNDQLLKAMEERNKELATFLLGKIQETLRNNYTASFDCINVNYKRIFGQQDIDYGDYDVIFYSANKKELFLIESKYMSDSLNISGLTNDYSKIFSRGGYYDHCRARYDLVINNPAEMKKLIGVDPNDTIKAFMLFVTSKPIETELQDKDGVVTFLSLGIFDGYLKGKFISEDGKHEIRPYINL